MADKLKELGQDLIQRISKGEILLVQDEEVGVYLKIKNIADIQDGYSILLENGEVAFLRRSLNIYSGELINN